MVITTICMFLFTKLYSPNEKRTFIYVRFYLVKPFLLSGFEEIGEHYHKTHLWICYSFMDK